MLILDQLRKSDRQLRHLAILVFLGLATLFAGLWHVQVYSGRRYQASHENQAIRTVRLPSIRGRILDRNGVALAENRPNFVVNLYLDGLRKEFDSAFVRLDRAWRLSNAGKKPGKAEIGVLRHQARWHSVSNAVSAVSGLLQAPSALDERKFSAHYERRRAYPLQVFHHLSREQVARFLEQGARFPGLDLEIQPERDYPFGTMAAHWLGHLRRDLEAEDEDDDGFDYRLPDYQGEIGVEGSFDPQLRGQPGVKSIVINNVLYRHSEAILQAPRPGNDLHLTMDAGIQEAAESALKGAGVATRGAVVVMEVRTGDVIAMASSPAYDPGLFVRGISAEEWAKMDDAKLKPQINRATYGAYQPGSIFKIVSGLAALEAGAMGPGTLVTNPGYFMLGRRRIDDLAPAGVYDFRRAFKKSSNTYFITFGLKSGLESILAMGRQFHFGEKTGLPLMQEVRGEFPAYEEILGTWSQGNAANVCIGQEITVTPIQVACMLSAVANGGTMFWPRLVQKLTPPDGEAASSGIAYERGRVRSVLAVKPEHLAVVREAMRADVMDADGTGHTSDVPGMEVCGKTGTAQITQGRRVIDHSTWFASFAPYSNPRYAVVVLVESGGSGGGTCGPVARKIYQAIQKQEQREGGRLSAGISTSVSTL